MIASLIEAEKFLDSPATALLSVKEFRAIEVPVFGHQSQIMAVEPLASEPLTRYSIRFKVPDREPVDFMANEEMRKTLAPWRPGSVRHDLRKPSEWLSMRCHGTCDRLLSSS